MESDANRSHMRVSQVDPVAANELIAQLGSLDLEYCFQCGMCSGSCPTATRMVYGPRRIMHMIRLGLIDEILRSDDIWVCVSCFSCAARCPQGVGITDVMSALRNLAHTKGLAKDEEAIFSRTFVDVLQRHGRMYEVEVLLRYYASRPGLSGVIGLFRQAGLGIKMLRKGKIGLRPDRIKNAQELHEIATRMGGGEQR